MSGKVVVCDKGHFVPVFGCESCIDMNENGKPISMPEWFTPTKTNKTQTKNVAKGRHPMGLDVLQSGNHTCGDCAHLVRKRGSSKNYIKCNNFEMTGGPGTDIRVKWPACVAFMAEEDL